MNVSPRILRDIAHNQKVVLFCLLGILLAGIVAGVMSVVEPEASQLGTSLVLLAISLIGTFYVFKLSVALYDRGTGIGLAVLTLIPIIGYAFYLVVNGKATKTLRQHGIRVGLMGANAADIPAATDSAT